MTDSISYQLPGYSQKTGGLSIRIQTEHQRINPKTKLDGSKGKGSTGPRPREDD